MSLVENERALLQYKFDEYTPLVFASQKDSNADFNDFIEEQKDKLERPREYVVFQFNEVVDEKPTEGGFNAEKRVYAFVKQGDKIVAFSLDPSQKLFPQLEQILDH